MHGERAWMTGRPTGHEVPAPPLPTDPIYAGPIPTVTFRAAPPPRTLPPMLSPAQTLPQSLLPQSTESLRASLPLGDRVIPFPWETHVEASHVGLAIRSAMVPSVLKDTYMAPLKPPEKSWYTSDLAKVEAGAMQWLPMFPSLFTFCCCILFVVPIWQTVHLGHDRSCAYWLGSYFGYATLLPLCFAVGHITHVQRQRPTKLAVMISLLLPVAVLLLMNDRTHGRALDLAGQLFSTDCDTFSGKRRLEHSWMAARDLYAKCLEETVNRTGKSRNLTLESAVDLYRVQDCLEYPDAHYKHERDWEYLWYLEEEMACSGWCDKGIQLWSYKEVRDSCSVAASQTFYGKIQRTAQQVVIFTLVVLLLVSIALIRIGPFLRKQGIEW